jgi:hypothetical protein
MRATLTFVVSHYRTQSSFGAQKERLKSKLFHTVFILLAKQTFKFGLITAQFCKERKLLLAKQP